MKQGRATSDGKGHGHTQPVPKGVSISAVGRIGQAGNDPNIYSSKRGITAPQSKDVAHPHGSQGKR
jgi:hypothetical protein